MIHLVAGGDAASFRACLALASPGDAVVLAGRGVSFLAEDFPPGVRVLADGDSLRAFGLAAEAAGRGVPAADRRDIAALIAAGGSPLVWK